MDDTILLASKIFESQNIQTFLFDEDFSDLELFDASLRKTFFPTEDYGRIKRWILSNCTEKNIYVLEDFFRLSSVVFPLEKKDNDEKQTFFIASPFTFEKITEESLERFISPSDNAEKLLHFYRTIPEIFHRDTFFSFLGAFFTELFGGELKISYHYFEGRENYLYSEKAEQRDEEYLKEVEARYNLEHKLHDAIRKADSQSAIRAFKQMQQTGIKPRSPSYVRNSQNFAIVLNSHLRKIMEECGVHPFYVDEVSRNFAIEIEKCTSSVQISDLSVKMIKTYCAQIASHKVAQFSEAVQKSILYIDFHFAEYVSLSVIAEELHLNPSYLSSQFTKETGENITEYINRTRIEHSLPLLAHREKSIVEIAGECGFDDMNYFSRVFKKIMKCSPSAYRSRLNH